MSQLLKILVREVKNILCSISCSHLNGSNDGANASDYLEFTNMPSFIMQNKI